MTTVQPTLPLVSTIVDIRVENGYTKTFTLDCHLAASPGQFVMAWLPGHEDKPFSLADVSPVKLTIAAVGPLSRAIHALDVGDQLWIRGPLGRGYHFEPRSAAHLLMVGGGYGVAPLLYLSRLALAEGHDATMVIGARSEQDLLLTEAFEALGVPLWITTDDGSQGIAGRVTDAVTQILDTAPRRPTTLYACGPTAMLSALAQQCAPENIAVQLAWEAHMRCGIGLCGSCEVGAGWLTCLDGPTFSFDPQIEDPA
ncbi:MAG: dihydroorotate dehydrogenase electron transfer subunit [Chloroflexota bacterium]